MKFSELKFIKGRCQLDYNYYVLSLSQINSNCFFECTIFNRAKLPIDLPGVKTDYIKNNKWVKINFSKLDIEVLIIKLFAVTGINKPKQLKESEFYKNIF